MLSKAAKFVVVTQREVTNTPPGGRVTGGGRGSFWDAGNVPSLDLGGGIK